MKPCYKNEKLNEKIQNTFDLGRIAI